jgi:selenide,water dikinase
LFYDNILFADGVKEYLAQRIIPDATYRNWNSYSTKVSFGKGVNVMEAFNTLPDPQTNGGLLIAVNENAVDQLKKVFNEFGLNNFLSPIGRMTKAGDKVVIVNTTSSVAKNILA